MNETLSALRVDVNLSLVANLYVTTESSVV